MLYLQLTVRVQSTEAEGCRGDQRTSRLSTPQFCWTSRDTPRRWPTAWRLWWRASMEPSRMWAGATLEWPSSLAAVLVCVLRWIMFVIGSFIETVLISIQLSSPPATQNLFAPYCFLTFATACPTHCFFRWRLWALATSRPTETLWTAWESL